MNEKKFVFFLKTLFKRLFTNVHFINIVWWRKKIILCIDKWGSGEFNISDLRPTLHFKGVFFLFVFLLRYIRLRKRTKNLISDLILLIFACLRTAYTTFSITINHVGFQTRRRPCMNEYNRPIEIQNICPGKDSESKTCYNKKCITNGHWSSWRQWSACDLMSCKRSRIRMCVKNDRNNKEAR